MTLQNEHEVREVMEAVKKIQNEVLHAQNSANTQQIQETKKHLHEVQDQILTAQGKATKGNDQSNVQLFEAQQQLEQHQQEMQRAEMNISAQQDETQ